jgi:hypothetical protein
MYGVIAPNELIDQFFDSGIKIRAIYRISPGFAGYPGTQPGAELLSSIPGLDRAVIQGSVRCHQRG